MNSRKNILQKTNNFKCHFCPICDGTGCIGEIPGMGGNHNNENFRLNCDGWEVVRKKILSSAPEVSTRSLSLSKGRSFESLNDLRSYLSLAPISGAVENVGYDDELKFYEDIVAASFNAKIDISIGDGCPDLKLKGAISAVEKLASVIRRSSPTGAVTEPVEVPAKANVFIKPYENEKIFERMKWADGVAKVFGVDIDSFNIATMKRLVTLEKKSAPQLSEIKNLAQKKGRPFAIKGVFNEADIDLVKEVRPDIVYISNHGGRVETRTGSTAEFFMHFGDVLKNYCAEIWVDGGIRTREDLETAIFLGAKKVLLGRPIISALCQGGKEAVNEAVSRLAS